MILLLSEIFSLFTSPLSYVVKTDVFANNKKEIIKTIIQELIVPNICNPKYLR